MSATSRSSPPVVVPGRSIGPVALGMTRDQVGRLGLEVKPHPSGQMGDGVRLVGPYYVVFDGDRVASVTFTLTGSKTGIVVEGRAVDERASLEDVARVVPRCGAPDHREGGVVVSCGDGTTLIKTGVGRPEEVEIQVVAAGFLDH